MRVDTLQTLGNVARGSHPSRIIAEGAGGPMPGHMAKRVKREGFCETESAASPGRG